jgi:hypothetical protein
MVLNQLSLLHYLLIINSLDFTVMVLGVMYRLCRSLFCNDFYCLSTSLLLSTTNVFLLTLISSTYTLYSSVNNTTVKSTLMRDQLIDPLLREP